MSKECFPCDILVNEGSSLTYKAKVLHSGIKLDDSVSFGDGIQESFEIADIQ